MGFRQRTWQRISALSKNARDIIVGTAGAGTAIAGLVGVAAPILNFTVPAVLAAHGADLLTSGLAAIIAALSPKQKPTNDIPNLSAPTEWTARLEIEKLHTAFRNNALEELVALGAYIVIAFPLGFLVWKISTEMPLTSGAVIASYAYIGLIRFMGFTPIRFTLPDETERAADLTRLTQVPFETPLTASSDTPPSPSGPSR